ncbi:hypothetical protein [Fulvivirga sp.]|uniref:hypothetical protein n=1 Tax=Fulvivirga sp. TaxID=1931237 RepID=UPI0032EFD555
MTRDEQLAFCKKCLNRKMDFQKGIVCSITGEQATFQGDCSDFKLDETVKEELNSVDPIETDTVIAQLSDDVLVNLRSEQNFGMALTSGIAVGLAGAILWGAITVATNYQIGYMAIAIGAGVGFTMRLFGKGIDQIFGISGGIIAVLSCVIGNFFSIIGFIATSEGLGYLETLFMFDFAYFIPVMTETFSGMDIFFYAIAGYEGYKFSFRVFTEQDLASLK